jgi:hypothetical protein
VEIKILNAEAEAPLAMGTSPCTPLVWSVSRRLWKDGYFVRTGPFEGPPTRSANDHDP